MTECELFYITSCFVKDPYFCRQLGAVWQKAGSYVTIQVEWVMYKTQTWKDFHWQVISLLRWN